MPLPAWNDPQLKAGTMVRGALWLVQEVGEGGTFTKEQIRAVFPGVAQADRRIRDLRAFGWTILASTEDATLLSEEQRFVKAGVPVWDPAARRAAQTIKITAKELDAAMENDGYMCTVCGIAGGEEYDDDPSQTAVLSATRTSTLLPDGDEALYLLTMCKRCRSGADGRAADVGKVLAQIADLDPGDQKRLAQWMDRGRRDLADLDRAWGAYRRLPAEARLHIRAKLG
ncbi:hypothetical protein ACFQO7_00030 [Catellatospora aurea]|uniref:HNH endonuclease n=1 Tax=Catellatospora aurea TaxID=1337874 RepID=A0ABW2GLQ2_9ACTN